MFARSKLWVLFAFLLSGFLTGVASASYSVEIDLSDQRAYLLYEGRVVLESPISSGRAKYRTPTGRFKLLSKSINHRSSLYGKIVDASGRTIVADADRDMSVPAGGRFVNAPMPYFMRFHGGIGLHAGYLPGYPASHGCVRMPKEYAQEFFSAIDIGTPVTVFGSAPQGRRVETVEPQYEERRVERVPVRRVRRWSWPWE